MTMRAKRLSTLRPTVLASKCQASPLAILEPRTPSQLFLLNAHFSLKVFDHHLLVSVYPTSDAGYDLGERTHRQIIRYTAHPGDAFPPNPFKFTDTHVTEPQSLRDRSILRALRGSLPPGHEKVRPRSLAQNRLTEHHSDT